MLVGPYANSKTMIAERFAVEHLKTADPQRVWVVQTREGAGLVHFYGSILHALRAPTGNSRDGGRKAEQVDQLLGSLKPRILIFDEIMRCGAAPGTLRRSLHSSDGLAANMTSRRC
jgi:hypothetical protein